jgi:hypothetical protein
MEFYSADIEMLMSRRTTLYMVTIRVPNAGHMRAKSFLVAGRAVALTVPFQIHGTPDNLRK